MSKHRLYYTAFFVWQSLIPGVNDKPTQFRDHPIDTPRLKISLLLFLEAQEEREREKRNTKGPVIKQFDTVRLYDTFRASDREIAGGI